LPADPNVDTILSDSSGHSITKPGLPTKKTIKKTRWSLKKQRHFGILFVPGDEHPPREVGKPAAIR